MKTLAIGYALGLVGVTLDGRGAAALLFLSISVSAVIVGHAGGTWHRQPKTQQRTESYGG